MILNTVTYDVRNNAIEVNWVNEVVDSDGIVQRYESCKTVSYSSEQKQELITDVGTDRYIQLFID